MASHGGAAHYSGGRFPIYFIRSKWQEDAVKGHQKIIGNSRSTWYNHSGRGVPDVSLLGDDHLVLGPVYTYSLKGTSASTPVFAAMIALSNDHRLRNGKAVLGALNPLNYKAKVASMGFHNVTDGDTEGCIYDKNHKTEDGWPAKKGWDAVSGMGKPSFVELLKYLG